MTQPHDEDNTAGGAQPPTNAQPSSAPPLPPVSPLRAPPPPDLARRYPHILGKQAPDQQDAPQPWLGVFFNCCSVYGRLYRNGAGTRYDGACPKCGATVSARIGPNGTSRRFFETT